MIGRMDTCLGLQVARIRTDRPPMNVPTMPTTVHSTRDSRMLTALLAGCDPCSYVAAGGSPDLYAGLAVEALARIEAGAGPADLVLARPGEADAGAAWQFASVAVEWCGSQR